MVSAGSVPAGSVSLDEDRVLVFELVRATEAAAVAAARFLGRGDRDEVDAAAVDAMRPVLGTIPMRGVVGTTRWCAASVPGWGLRWISLSTRWTVPG